MGVSVMATQQNFYGVHRRHRYCYGGQLRKQVRGRGQRPLSCKQALHAVFKIDRTRLRHRGLRVAPCFYLIHQVVRQYSKRFYVKVEKISIQGDHIHMVIRTTRRSHFHYFFRVVAGQIAQRFEHEGLLSGSLKKSMTDTPQPRVSVEPRNTITGLGRCLSGKKQKKGTKLWLLRPFSRVVLGAKAFQTVMDYVQLNEQEALGKIKYQKLRLRGLSSGEWAILWS